MHTHIHTHTWPAQIKASANSPYPFCTRKHRARTQASYADANIVRGRKHRARTQTSCADANIMHGRKHCARMTAESHNWCLDRGHTSERQTHHSPQPQGACMYRYASTQHHCLHHHHCTSSSNNDTPACQSAACDPTC